jgi:serine phosphatase RsbU (regulator of sigma subunit)
VGLMLYFISSRDKMSEELKDLNNNLDYKVKERTEELEASNTNLNNANEELQALLTQLTDQKEIIENKNRQITDSINYAQRIQSVILTNYNDTCNALPDHFILFKPKDIVSGDFYWTWCNKSNVFIFAAVDCTGHGVPGAFMSLIGDSLLNKLVIDQNIYDPAILLQRMDEELQIILKSKKQNTKEGMDLGICVIHQDKQLIEFAGARNPMVAVENGELKIYEANKCSIGGDIKMRAKKFQKHQINYKAGSTYYLYSDGFQDQFGGELNRKYLSTRFRKLLFATSHYPLEKQKEFLEKELENWIGYHAQTDDILVAGIRL